MEVQKKNTKKKLTSHKYQFMNKECIKKDRSLEWVEIQ